VTFTDQHLFQTYFDTPERIQHCRRYWILCKLGRRIWYPFDSMSIIMKHGTISQLCILAGIEEWHYCTLGGLVTPRVYWFRDIIAAGRVWHGDSMDTHEHKYPIQEYIGISHKLHVIRSVSTIDFEST
jgi:hypothetical protein